MSAPASAVLCSGPTPPRLRPSRDLRNLAARIAGAEREGWLGEIEGFQVSLAGAKDRLAQIDGCNQSCSAVDLGIAATRLSSQDRRWVAQRCHRDQV